jgi:hypothetical protein
MAVELQWKESGETIEEPFANTASTLYTFTLTNAGTNSAQSIGFYLKPATLEGDIDNPSSNGILADWYDVLVKGEAGGSPLPGFHLIQGASDKRFTFDEGSSAEVPIALTIGSGDGGGTLEPGEEVTIQMKYVPEPGDPTRRLYVQVDLTYTEV